MDIHPHMWYCVVGNETKPQKEKDSMNAKIIGFVNEKGGVGKSTSAASLAYLLGEQGVKTLLVDFDGQAHASLLMGVENVNLLPVTIGDLLNRVILGEPLPDPESYLITRGNTSLIPSSSRLFTLERNLCQTDFRERILTQFLAPLRPSYDLILIDCMPQLGA